jgi:outer membrane protein OmpA-like peptidoglycan-associated protein
VTSLYSQRMQTRTLNDSVFRVGDLVTLPQLTYALGRCALLPEAMDSLQLLTAFINTHPGLSVEIGYHTDYVNPNSSQAITQCRACACRDSLVRRGVDSDRIVCKGYGMVRPYITQKTTVLPSGTVLPAGAVINESFRKKFQGNKADYEVLCALNRRTELKILSSAPPYFKQSDTPVQTTFNGIYKGQPVYVQNPYSVTDTMNGNYCIQKLFVNGKEIPVPNTLAFVIFPDSLGFSKGDSLKLMFLHKPDCRPRIVVEWEEGGTGLALLSMDVDSTGMLRWKMGAVSGPCSYEVEQFLWNRWVQVGMMPGSKSGESTIYCSQTKLHTGINRFRIRQWDASNNPHLSKEAIYTTGKKKLPVVRLLTTTIQNEICFSEATMYELYDSFGSLIKKGKDKSIECSSLPPGLYFLNFDNQSTGIQKR